MEIQTLLEGEYDERSAVVTIRSGAEAARRGRLRADAVAYAACAYCERNGFKAKVMDTSYAKEAGIKSGHLPGGRAPYAYGRLSGGGRHSPSGTYPPFDKPGPPPDQLRCRGSGAAGRGH